MIQQYTKYHFNSQLINLSSDINYIFLEVCKMFLLYHKIENSYFTMYFFNQDISYNIAPNLLKSGWSRDKIQDFSFFHIEKWL